MKVVYGLGLVSALALSVASAPANAEMEVTIGGYTAFQAAAFGNDDPTSTDRDFRSEAEIHVHADGKADNGLKYGAYLELLASTSDNPNADEANVYLESDMGRLELGDQDGAGSQLGVVAPFVGVGQVVTGVYTRFIPAADRAYEDGSTDSNLKAMDSSDSTKVTYYTPKYMGFQAGLSYVPENGNEGESVVLTNPTSDHQDLVEMGLQYNGEFEGVGVKVGGQYTTADATAASGVEDINAWNVGMQLAYEGFTLGGSYTYDGHSALTQGVTDDDVSNYTVGLTYEQDAWGLGASYVYVDFDTNGYNPGAATVDVGGDYSAYGVGGVYKIVPGMTVGADVVFYDRDRAGSANDTDGYVFLTDVRASF